MIERKQYVPGKPGPKVPHKGNFRKDDGRARNGRPKGVPNKVTGLIKDALLHSMEYVGDRVQTSERILEVTVDADGNREEKIIERKFTKAELQANKVDVESGLTKFWIKIFDTVIKTGDV